MKKQHSSIASCPTGGVSHKVSEDTKKAATNSAHGKEEPSDTSRLHQNAVQSCPPASSQLTGSETLGATKGYESLKPQTQVAVETATAGEHI